MPEGDTGVIGISGCIGEVMALPLFILLFQSEYSIPLHPRLAQSAKPPPSASNPGALPGTVAACSHNTTRQAKLDQDLGYVLLHSPFAGKTLKTGAKHGTLRVTHPVL